MAINVIAIIRDGHRWVFIFDAASIPELLRTVGRDAADPELNFSWYDAAVVSQKARRLVEAA